MSHPARIPRVDYLEQEIKDLLELAAACAVETPTAAVAARAKAGDFRDKLDQLRAFEEDQATAATRTPVEQVRAMRMRADAAGSHISARDLLKVELELMAKAEAKAKAEEQERLANLTEAQIGQMLLDQLRALPSELRDQLLGQLVPTTPFH